MRVPWRFLLALPLGLFLGMELFIGLLYTQLGVPTESSHWAYDLIQKKEALAASSPGPRLFLVAGSSTLFGISGQVIEQRTGCRTLNFGTHGGLDLDYILHTAQKNLRPGDTALLAIEYQLYTEALGSEPHDDYVLARDPDYFRQMSWWSKLEMATRIPFKRFQKGFRNRQKPEATPRPHPPYTNGASYLNENGDELGGVKELRPATGATFDVVVRVLADGLPSDQTAGFAALADFITWAQAHQITVLATFPNIIYQPAYEGPNAQKALATITHFYTSRGVPVIGTAREAMLPRDQFFDTIYHLMREPAIARTERLVPELRPYLKGSK